MHITDLKDENQKSIDSAARILFECFGQPYAWPTVESALEEVEDSLQPEHVSLIALDDTGEVMGWIAGMSDYDGLVWELHPMAVDPKHQAQGVGRALVQEFERRVALLGCATIMLGTDDVEGQTSLGGIELYPDVWNHIQAIRNIRRHPYEFYQKLGFSIVGVVPDANGPGKPDILMAKKVSKAES